MTPARDPNKRSLGNGEPRPLPVIPRGRTFPEGWARRLDPEDGIRKAIRIGNRYVPKLIQVHLDGRGGQPAVDLFLEVIDGVPECRRIEIASVDGGREIKGIDLEIKVGEWVDDAFDAFALEVVDEDDGVTVVMGKPETEEAFAESLSAFAAARRGKGARSPENLAFLEEVAEVFTKYEHDDPNRHVEKHFHVAERTAQGYVTFARRAGILPPTTRGKKGRGKV